MGRLLPGQSRHHLGQCKKEQERTHKEKCVLQSAYETDLSLFFFHNSFAVRTGKTPARLEKLLAIPASLASLETSILVRTQAAGFTTTLVASSQSSRANADEASRRVSCPFQAFRYRSITMLIAFVARCLQIARSSVCLQFLDTEINSLLSRKRFSEPVCQLNIRQHKNAKVRRFLGML